MTRLSDHNRNSCKPSFVCKSTNGLRSHKPTDPAKEGSISLTRLMIVSRRTYCLRPTTYFTFIMKLIWILKINFSPLRLVLGSVSKFDHLLWHYSNSSPHTSKTGFLQQNNIRLTRIHDLLSKWQTKCFRQILFYKSQPIICSFLLKKLKWRQQQNANGQLFNLSTFIKFYPALGKTLHFKTIILKYHW